MRAKDGRGATVRFTRNGYMQTETARRRESVRRRRRERPEGVIHEISCLTRGCVREVTQFVLLKVG